MPALEVRPLPLNDLVLIPELSPREKLSEETVIRYMESFNALPPIRVQAESLVVVDGFHRVESATRLGLEEISAELHPIPDEELRMVAGLANVKHGQPLSRPERNRLAVALVRTYGKLREEAAELLGVSPGAVTLALREHQFNEMLSEKLGTPVQVINSAHVRALYRVGADQRERLLEAVVSKVDENGDPYPLTGAELKLLVDRMLDPATPAAELNRLLSDPKARPKAPPGAKAEDAAVEDPFFPEPGNTKPWEREWESPLKGGDTEAFDRVRGVDEQLQNAGAYAGRERQIADLMERAEVNVRERTLADDYHPFWGSADAPGGSEDDDTPLNRLRGSVLAAARALEEIIPQAEPADVRSQLQAVLALLQSLQ
jgi:ParB-like chromosome segregation protein Spo0J